MKRSADWIGPQQRRFRWTRLRVETGLYHYIVNGLGDTLAHWWVWDQA